MSLLNGELTTTLCTGNIECGSKEGKDLNEARANGGCFCAWENKDCPLAVAEVVSFLKSGLKFGNIDFSAGSSKKLKRIVKNIEKLCPRVFLIAICIVDSSKSGYK